jgi:multimeric flavodoxin WrbA
MARVLVVYHSRKGTQQALATAAAEGAAAQGASVRLRQLPSTKDDLLWADGIVWGAPTFYGNVSTPVKEFIDSTSDLWRAGLLADRVVTGLTSSTSLNGGQEATLLSLYRSMYHWGAVVMSGDSSWPGWAETGANPYGVSVCAGEASPLALDAAANAGGRVAHLSGRLRDGSPVRPRIVVVHQEGPPALVRLARVVASGAAQGGATVRLCAAGEVAPADIAWADGVAWGLHARTGMLPAALAHVVETTQEALPAGDLRGRTTTAFGTTVNAHAGGESALLSAYVAMHNWDALIVAPGYTDPAVTAAGGNPYGTLLHERNGPRLSDVLAAARHQGRRLARMTGLLARATK